MNCLLCNKEMNIEKYEGVEIDICPDCGGVWLDKDELAHIVQTQEEKFTPSQIKATLEETSKEKAKREELMRYVLHFKKDVPLEKLNFDEVLSAFRERWGNIRQLKCPKCDNNLEEFEYAGTGIMLDQCPQHHGFWLDKGELTKIQIMMEYYQRTFESMEPSQDTTLTERKCPICQERMEEKEYEAVPIDICRKCGGVWLDKDELYRIVETREEKFSEEEKSKVSPEELKQPKQQELVEEIKCPICGALMNRFAYACFSGVIIDRCPQGDGVWLDKGELEKIQIYVEKSEEMSERDYAKYTRILTQAKLDLEQRQQQRRKEFIESSPYGAPGRALRWIARSLAEL